MFSPNTWKYGLKSLFYTFFSKELQIFSCCFLYPFWEGLENPLVSCLRVSVLNLHNPDHGMPNIFSMLNLMEFVLKAYSWAASIIILIFFLRNPFLSHRHNSLIFISTVCLINFPCWASSLKLLLFNHTSSSYSL